MPVYRRFFGRAFRVSHGGSACAIWLSLRTAFECARKRYHPVCCADPCSNPLHDRVHRRCEIRVLKAVSHADKRFVVYPRQGMTISDYKQLNIKGLFEGSAGNAAKISIFGLSELVIRTEITSD